MSYIFALCSPDKRFPKMREWYLRIDKESQSQIAEVFSRLNSSLELKFGYNRHYFNQHTGEPSSDMSMIFHPMILGAHWMTLAIDLYTEYGVLYVGTSGQMFPPDPEKFIEHGVKSSPQLQYPTVVPNEYIIITKWQNGRHYYLESNIGRIFSEEKYDSYDAAFAEALKYIERKHISYREDKKGIYY